MSAFSYASTERAEDNYQGTSSVERPEPPGHSHNIIGAQLCIYKGISNRRSRR